MGLYLYSIFFSRLPVVAKADNPGTYMSELAPIKRQQPIVSHIAQLVRMMCKYFPTAIHVCVCVLLLLKPEYAPKLYAQGRMYCRRFCVCVRAPPYECERVCAKLVREN